MVKDKEYDLVNEFLKGDEKSFNKLVLQFQKNIYWHARRMVGNHLDADEVTQQVIIVLYNKLGSFNFNSSLKTWIYRVTLTRSLNLIKKRSVKQFFGLNEDVAKNLKNDFDIITNFEDKERLEKLNNLLDKLPIKQREVFVLRHFEELNYKEISKITGKSIGGLKANYFHASKKIFGMMKDEK